MRTTPYSILTILIVCFASVVFAEDKPATGPSGDVLVAGQLVKFSDRIAQKLTTPIPADAAIEVPGATTTILVNIYPSDADGKVAQAASPEVIMVTGTTKFKLNQTMSNKPLAPGTYRINVSPLDGITTTFIATIK